MSRTQIHGTAIKDDSVTGDDVDESTLILDTLRDADGDTKIQIEESADEDTIRFDTAGDERLVIGSDGAIAFGNTSTPGEPGTFNFFNFKGGGVRVQAHNFYADNDRGILWGDSSVSIKGNASAGDESLTVRANYNAFIHVDGVDNVVGIGTTTPHSSLHVQGSQAVMYDDFDSTTLTLGVQHFIVDYVNTGDTASVVTLPDPSTCTGRRYYILNNSSGGGNVTVSTPAGYILGTHVINTTSTSVVLEGDGNTHAPQSINIVSTGTNWFILHDGRLDEPD
jgi:hypothetical protein